MAEPISLAASIIAVVQLAGLIAGVCKSFIETVQDYPKDLRVIFIETGSLKVIFEGLGFLDKDDLADSAMLQRLRGSDGPIEGCEAAMVQLHQLFASLSSAVSKQKGKKKKKLKMTLASLAWPFKVDTARKLLGEIIQHKSTITVALQGQLLYVVLASKTELFLLTFCRSEFRHMKAQLNDLCCILDGKLS